MEQAERRTRAPRASRRERAAAPAAGIAVAAALAVKLALLALVVYAATHRHLPELGGRTTTARVAVYPLVALAVPLAWSLVQALRRRRVAYPAATDALLTLPFTIDLAATIANLHERARWDAAAHFTYWALLAGACGALALRLRLTPLVAAVLVLGFGAASAIVWEVAEYKTLHRFPTLADYSGTIRDLALALAASALAAAVTAVAALVRGDRPDRRPPVRERG